ncbi:MAG: hypothetical protein LQ341_006620, partial [Variospora aurantia]
SSASAHRACTSSSLKPSTGGSSADARSASSSSLVRRWNSPDKTMRTAVWRRQGRREVVEDGGARPPRRFRVGPE